MGANDLVQRATVMRFRDGADRRIQQLGGVLAGRLSGDLPAEGGVLEPEGCRRACSADSSRRWIGPALSGNLDDGVAHSGRTASVICA